MAFASAVALTPVILTALTAVNSAISTTPDLANGNKFVCNKSTILRVANTNAATRTVTVHINRTIDGQVVPNDAFVVPATSGDVLYTGFTTNNWMNEAGEAHIEFSAITNVTVGVFQPE